MLSCKSAVSPGTAGVKLALARRSVLRFILSPWCNVFPISLRCDAHSCSPAWPVCDCVCVIALCQGQGRAAGPRLSGASAHLGKFRLNSSTFLNTQLIETLTNSNPRARPQMGREPRQGSERGSCSRVEIPTVQSQSCVIHLLLIYTLLFFFFLHCLSCERSAHK